MTALTEVLGTTLAEHGVRHAFGVVGGGNILLAAGLTGAGIRYVPARHEGGAMAMADAYHRVTGQVAVCTTTHGPGLTNTTTALAEAVKHGSAVLVVTGDAPTSGPRAHDVDQPALVAAAGAQVCRITDPATAARTVLDALGLARRLGRPVVLCIPNDLVRAEVPRLADPAPAPPAQRLRVPETMVAGEMGAVVDAIATARHPLLLAGLGACRAGASKAITDLGDRLGALYATTVMASGLFHGNRWSCGVIGGFAAPAAAAVVGEADLVIAFGASLDPFTLRHGRLLHPGATLVQIDIAPGRDVDRVTIGVTADASVAASALLDAVNARDLPPARWRDTAAGALEDTGWDRETYEQADEEGRIDPRTLTSSLAELLPRERTLVLDGGQFIEWPVRYWPVAEPSALAFMGAAFQTIGLGLAGAVGAAIGRPDRLTVAALGDGGALMGLPELETLIRTGVSALVVVYDDAAFGFEVNMYLPQGADAATAVFAETDFAGIARALGAEAVTVRRGGDLWAVRTWRARGCPGTLLLDCKIARGVVPAFLSELIAGHPAGH